MITFFKNIWFKIVSIFYYDCLLCNNKTNDIQIDLTDEQGRTLITVHICENCLKYINDNFGTVDEFFASVFDYFRDFLHMDKE